jgi:hypothetical protein
MNTAQKLDLLKETCANDTELDQVIEIIGLDPWSAETEIGAIRTRPT